jgi:hypothetical protein
MANLDVQAEIDAQISAGGLGGIVDLPSGEITVSDTINVQQVRGLVIRGRAAIVTDLKWEGPSDRPMFRFNRTQGTILERLSITARQAYPLLEGVRIEQGTIDNSDANHWPDLTSSLMTARDVIFRGQGALGIAIRVYLHSLEDDAKNDITASSVSRYRAVRTPDSSSKAGTLRRSISIKSSCRARSQMQRSVGMECLRSRTCVRPQ